MTRLPVLESTVKQLYGSASMCAHPTCDEPLLRWIEGFDTPVLNSRIAHIRAASPLGARYDKAMTDEDRRAFDNLVLLCLPHAEEVDLKALADRYPVETLRQWKLVQLQAAPPKPPNIPEGLERAVVLSMGDLLMDFREATIDLGGKAAIAPGAGGSGGGAIGPGARGGDGGLVVTSTTSPSQACRFWARFRSRLVMAVVAGWLTYPARPEDIHALGPS